MADRPLETLVSAWAEKRILILGDIILDEYIWGDVRRISPEAPVPVVEVRRRSLVLGGAGNVAANVAALGGSAQLGGVIGSDTAGQSLRDMVARHRIDSGGLVVDPGRVTTTKSRVIAHNQQVVRLDVEEPQPVAPAVESRLGEWLEDCMGEADACVVSDYAKGTVTGRLAHRLIGTAQRLGRPVVVDPKGNDYARYRGATVVKPNIQEAALACGRQLADENSLLEGARHLAALLDGAALVITQGGQGMFVYQESEAPVRIHSTARQVFDVTGAGDTVTSVLALGLAAGLSLVEAARLANIAAGVVVGKIGTATLTPQELRLAALHASEM